MGISTSLPKSIVDPSVSLAFSIFENKGLYALLLGSGLSRAAQIPTGWEITLDLIRRVGAIDGVLKQSDWAEWYRQKTGIEPNYSTILDDLSSVPAERRSILHSYIEPTPEDIQEGKRIPTKAHHAIAWLVQNGFVKIILTTNFDRLTENALREIGIEPTVIRSDDDLRGAIPLAHAQCYIIKLHGDYLDARIKNTEDELSTYSPSMSALLDRVLDEYGLIVCGWSGDWDHALRAAITRAPNRRFPTFWAAKGTPSAAAEELINQRSAKLISITGADSFFEQLQQRAAAQLENQRPDPKSIQLLVQLCKLYLSRDEFRISLHDLVTEEYRDLSEIFSDPEFSFQTQISSDELNRRAVRYEAATEKLAHILGIIGLWNNGAGYDLASRILSAALSQKTLWWLCHME